MNDFKASFKALRDDLSLTSDERASMRAVLESRMNAPTTELMVRPVPSVVFPPLFFLRQGAFAFAALLLVVSGGGIVAAEGALPGETLYSIKLGVNERFERFAAVGTVAKAEVDIRHAEERIREVELLAAKGDDVRALADITDAVDEHLTLASEAAKQLADEGDAADADRVAARIDSALAAHAEILVAQAENEDGDERKKLRALSVALSVAAEDHALETDETTPRDEAYYASIAEARRQEVDERIESIRKALTGDGVPDESTAEFTTELSAIEADFALAKENEAAGEVKDAAETYEELGKRAYRTYAVMTSANRVADETDGEVLVSLGEEEVPEEEASGTAAMFLMVAPAEDTASAKRSAIESDGPALKFLIRDRSSK